MLDGAALGDVFDAFVALCAFGALALRIWKEYARCQASKPDVRVTIDTGFSGLNDGKLSNGELMVGAVNDWELRLSLNRKICPT
jgi:hypothetical protein